MGRLLRGLRRDALPERRSETRLVGATGTPVGSFVFMAMIVSLVFAANASADDVDGPSQSEAPFGRIERLDPRFDKLIGRDAKLEVLAEGFEWSEGPVWISQDDSVLFSDIPNNAVMRWSADDGLTTHLEPSGYTGPTKRGGEPGSNGLALDAVGRLVMCQHGDRRIVRVEPNGQWTTLVDRYEGKRLNSPNDLVFAADGSLYFTDPPYGLPGGPDSPVRELDWCGVYRLGVDGRLTLLTDEMTRPNGIAFSPDGRTLYVAQSDPKKAVWMAFDVTDEGGIGNGRVLADATPWVRKVKGLPDGMAIDAEGNLFATGPGGVWVIAADGDVLGRIDTGQATANCCFGGPEGSELFITADMLFCRIKTKTKGLEVGRRH